MEKHSGSMVMVHPNKLIPSLPAHPHPLMNHPSPYAQPAVVYAHISDNNKQTKKFS